MSTIKNKIAGAIYGFAIGDAMGATTEFMNHAQIKKQYGQVTDIIGGGWLNLKAGKVTDDTQMTICVMDALMRNTQMIIYAKNALTGNIELFEECCMGNFIEWYRMGPKDVGGQCSRGIICAMSTGHFIEKDDMALGNGSLMRAMPCALINRPDLNVAQGKLTHNNSECSQIILEYTRLIQNILYNNLYTYKVKSILEPSGYIRDTFNNSLYWANKPSFEKAIIGAVNDGGDADTIAAITGSIAGARFGYDAIPQRWIDQLDSEVKIYLEKFKNFVFSYLQI